ncbi:response regulator transcription factor [Pseudomonas sp. 102515]|uniref:response regulator transcription factor n=1 Tax=Pseudomonas sp. 102515 TaxID=3071568 RepID=UPI00280321D4|nr:response regulator transcription factor [Pseudomonas sp. 102515]MDQ7914141.1 response regulator transcription factor [Pseudomonas sp. 102515]
MTAIHVLLVDDHRKLREPLAIYLRRQGLEATTAADATRMKALLAQQRFDVIVLDVMLPDGDGFSLCRELRQRDTTPVMLLTARGEVDDRVLGLEQGADDYLTKPFEPRELVARIRTLHRRYQATTPTVAVEPTPAAAYRFADWHYIPLTQCLRHADGSTRRLGQAEARLLLAFLCQPRTVLHRDLLLHQVRPPDRALEDRSLDRQVSRLRLRLADPAGESPLRTVWGRGYLLDCPVEALDGP